MDFVKMEGLGNDFVVVRGPFEPSAATVRAWCDRRRGIGADGVLTVTPLDPTTVRMEYWNADGSPAEMCGNGLRCVTLYAVTEGLVSGPTFTVRTAVGDRSVTAGEGTARVELGPATPSGTTASLVGLELASVSVGNPHAVAFVDDCYAIPVEAMGPIVEGDPTYPERTNVEFATVVNPGRIALRVWERGVGETLACGTGAAATVAEAFRSGRTGPKVTVVLPGGELVVEIIDGVAWIEGPASESFRGVVEA